MIRPSTLRPLRLEALCHRLDIALPEGVEPDTEVHGLTHNCRAVLPGDLYVGMPGRHVHGSDFAPEAARRGAVAMVSDCAHPALPTLTVANPRAATGPLSSVVYGLPSERLAVTGVTGTNGKTTTAFLLDHLLSATGRAVGRTTTIDVVVGERSLPSVLTTPEAPDLQAALACMVENGCDSAVVEVSSHGLMLGRVAGTRFRVGVFTNLSRDHHAFHGSAEAYLAAKASLFTGDACGAGVINIDDPAGRKVASVAACPVTTVSASGAAGADWRVTRAEPRGLSTHFTVAGPAGEFTASVPLPGFHNLENTILALAAAHLHGLDVREAAKSLTDFRGVPGRLEFIDCGQPFLAVVDFAHNPAGIEAALRTLRFQVDGRIIIVFGAPGKGDRGKRPLMRAAASALADVLIVTTDDPYDEDPEQIIADVMAGADPIGDGVEYIIERDRASAIIRATELAQSADAVLIAGRGHETEQMIGGERIPFGDRDQLCHALGAVPGRLSIDSIAPLGDR